MNIFARLNQLPRWARISLRAISISAASAFGIWLSENYSRQYADDAITSQAVYWTSWIVVLSIVVSISYTLETLSDLEADREVKRRSVMAFAYERIDRWIAASLRTEREIPLSSEALAHEKIKSLSQSAELLIQGLYEVLESQYGGRSSDGSRIDFEVTFMTKSYIDDGITLAAWANRSHRAPRSLTHLRPNNPQFYKDTVTADVYRMPRPRPVLVSDTVSTTSYKEIYPDQKGNIKSTIVFPVLDDSSSLVGTIVCHCDASGFFKAADQKFWYGLIEIFSRRMALIKRRMDSVRSQLDENHALPF